MLPLHQRPAWLRVMIVRPMRLPDRGFITTEAGRDSNGSVFTECGNRQKIRHSCIALESNQRPPRYEQGALTD